MTDDIHSCNFYCPRVACVVARAREWEQQRKRIAELEAENDKLRAVLHSDVLLSYEQAKIEAERDALKLDAERYRKLVRSGRYSPSPFGWWGLCTGNLTHVSSKEEFDAAIDAAKGE